MTDLLREGSFSHAAAVLCQPVIYKIMKVTLVQIPFNFLAGIEGIPAFDEHLQKLSKSFTEVRHPARSVTPQESQSAALSQLFTKWEVKRANSAYLGLASIV